MATMFCGDCGASNSKTATECKKCKSTNLRSKTADPSNPPPGAIAPSEGDLFDPKGDSEPSEETSLPGKPLVPPDKTDREPGEAHDFFAPLPSDGTFRVEVIAGPCTGKVVELKEDSPVTLGAAPSNDVDLSGDPYASKKHASVTLKGGRVLLADEGSTNGTYLRVSDHWEIENGAEILIGKTLLRVKKTE